MCFLKHVCLLSWWGSNTYTHTHAQQVWLCKQEDGIIYFPFDVNVWQHLISPYQVMPTYYCHSVCHMIFCLFVLFWICLGPVTTKIRQQTREMYMQIRRKQWNLFGTKNSNRSKCKKTFSELCRTALKVVQGVHEWFKTTASQRFSRPTDGWL